MPVGSGTRQRIRNIFGRDRKELQVQEPESHLKSTPSTPRSSSPLPSTVPNATQSASSDASTSQHESLQGQLWNQAYDALKDKEADLVEAYEKLLSHELSGGDRDSSHIDERPTNLIAQTNSERRKSQMNQIVEAGLKKTEKVASIQSGLGEKTRVLSSMKDLISAAVKSSPEASLAWTGACFCMQMLENPISESSSNRDGVTYVLSRMKWYWELSGLLNDGGDSTIGLRVELQNHIVELYKTLLSYQMKSVCLYYRNRGVTFLRDLIKLDDWESTLKSLKSAEDVVREDYHTYNTSNMADRLNGLLEAANSECSILRDIASFIQQQTKAEQQRQTEEKKEREDDKNNQYLIDLRATDSRLDKERIEKTKGGLLPKISNWILGHQSFRNWREKDESQLLWIKGDPGKGKTMLLIAIINELERSLADATNSDQQTSPSLIYFFCQGTNSALNSATAVLRGLIYRFVKECPPLISYLQKAYADSGSKLLDHNAFFALSHILRQMLNDERIPQAYIVIDALDECDEDLLQLLDFIVENFARQPIVNIKWIISSRLIDRIEKQLVPIASEGGYMALRLGETQEQITDAVNAFIDVKISQLGLEEEETKVKIRETLREKAAGTFLWVALVFEELQNTPVWEIDDVLEEIPSSLKAIYSRILDRILPPDEAHTNSRENVRHGLCRLILSRVTLAYRPLYLDELAMVSELPKNKQKYIKEIVKSCGSLLAISEDQVYLVHQSVKDFLSGEAAKERIFPSGLPTTHLAISLESLNAMTKTLKRNIYNLSSPGLPNSEFKAHGLDPLISVRYSCVHWISHFCNAYRKAEVDIDDDDGSSSSSSFPMSLEGLDTVRYFFENCFLYWVEALGILRQLGNAIVSMKELEQILRKWNPEDELVGLVYDCRRFALNNIWLIETTPLQTYVSALVFSPTSCKIRNIKKYKDEEPNWITIKSKVDDAWSPCLQTLEGHKNSVWSIAFSRDSRLLASGCLDRTIRIWDAGTGAFQQSLDASALVFSVAFSPDSILLAAGCDDSSIRVWDTATRTLQYVLRHHENDFKIAKLCQGRKRLTKDIQAEFDDTDLSPAQYDRNEVLGNENILSVAFSYDSSLLASGSEGNTIAIWDSVNHQLQHILSGHNDKIKSLAFSPNSFILVSASTDCTIKIWDAATGNLQQTLTGYDAEVRTVAFSPNSQFLASGSEEGTIKVWDTKTWMLRNTLEAHEVNVGCVVFSPDGKFLASAAGDRKAKIWNTTTWSLQQTFQNHDLYLSLAFSSDSKTIALGTVYCKIKIWDTETRNDSEQVSEYHDSRVNSVTISHDSKLLASASSDKTIKVWNIATMTVRRTLQGHKDWVNSADFSPDSKFIATASSDKTVKIWDPETGNLHKTLEGSHSMEIAAFSRDGCLLVSACRDRTIKIWETANWDLMKSIQCDDILWRLSFDQTGMYLDTDEGRFQISDGSRVPEVEPLRSDLVREIGWGLDRDQSWITWNSNNVLWIPPDYRVSSYYSDGTQLIESPTVTMIANGTDAGRVVVIEVPKSGPFD